MKRVTERPRGQLLANASTCTGDEGQVTVRLSRERGHARLSWPTLGGGIAPEFLLHVFGLFHHSDASAVRKGGLGLVFALLRGLVLAHGDAIEASS